MNIEPDAAAKASSPDPAKEKEEIAELEFEEDHEEELISNQPPVVPMALASEKIGPEGEFSLPSIFQGKVLDIVLKLHPAQASVQPQLWLGLRSGQYPPLLRVFDGLDLGQLAFRLASLLEKYAHQIEGINAARAGAATNSKSETNPKPVIPPQEKLSATPAPVQSDQPTTTREAGKNKKVEQLSFF